MRSPGTRLALGAQLSRLTHTPLTGGVLKLPLQRVGIDSLADNLGSAVSRTSCQYPHLGIQGMCRSDLPHGPDATGVQSGAPKCYFDSLFNGVCLSSKHQQSLALFGGI